MLTVSTLALDPCRRDREGDGRLYRCVAGAPDVADDGTALTPRSVIVALLALVRGEEPAAAVKKAGRL